MASCGGAWAWPSSRPSTSTARCSPSCWPVAAGGWPSRNGTCSTSCARPTAEPPPAMPGASHGVHGLDQAVEALVTGEHDLSGVAGFAPFARLTDARPRRRDGRGGVDPDDPVRDAAEGLAPRPRHVADRDHDGAAALLEGIRADIADDAGHADAEVAARPRHRLTLESAVR